MHSILAAARGYFDVSPYCGSTVEFCSRPKFCTKYDKNLYRYKVTLYSISLLKSILSASWGTAGNETWTGLERELLMFCKGIGKVAFITPHKVLS